MLALADARRIVAVPVGLALLAGCGSGGAPATTPQAPPERFDPRPALPEGWRRVVNPRSGFSIGVPPGWGARVGRITLLRSPSRAVSVGISADRSADGQSSAPLEQYAVRTIRALSGYRGLRAGRPARLRGARYPTVTVPASGVYRRTGVPQRIQLASIRRPGRVTFTLLFFRDARATSAADASTIRRMIRSFSAQPPRF